jgi:hypothetical protein
MRVTACKSLSGIQRHANAMRRCSHLRPCSSLLLVVLLLCFSPNASVSTARRCCCQGDGMHSSINMSVFAELAHLTLPGVLNSPRAMCAVLLACKPSGCHLAQHVALFWRQDGPHVLADLPSSDRPLGTTCNDAADNSDAAPANRDGSAHPSGSTAQQRIGSCTRSARTASNDRSSNKWAKRTHAWTGAHRRAWLVSPDDVAAVRDLPPRIMPVSALLVSCVAWPHQACMAGQGERKVTRCHDPLRCQSCLPCMPWLSSCCMHLHTVHARSACCT